MAMIIVKNMQGEGLGGINIRLSLGDGDSDSAYDDRFTYSDGTTAWPNPLPSSKGYNLFVNHGNENKDYQPLQIHVNNFDNDILITLDRVSLPQLKIDGLYFNRPHLRGNTDFMWYKKFLDVDINVNSVIRQRYNVGSKFIRTFGMTSAASFGTDFRPQDYGNKYYDNIQVAARMLESFGMYWYFNIFADTQLVMPGAAQQLDHYNRVVDELSKCNNIFMELVNEQDQHSNGVARESFKKPDSFIACSGSYGSRNPPQEPHWDFIDYHTRRDYPGCVMECNVTDYNDNGKTRPSIGKPIGTGEPVKLGTGFETLERIAYEVGHAGIGSSPFNVFHTPQGVHSELWDGTTEGLARQFFKE